MILSKIIKIVATSCQILRLNSPISTSAGAPSPTQTPLGHSAPPNPLARFKGPTSRKRGGNDKGGEEGREKRGRRKGQLKY